MKKIYTLILAVSSLAATAQTNNNFPVTGSATIFDYSPMLILKRNTNDGGFIQGIQTQLLDGTNNWFYGAVHEGKWTVGKGDYQNEKLTVSNNGNIGIGASEPAAKLHIGQSNQEIRFDYDGSNYHYGSLRWAALQLGNNGTNRIVAGRSAAGGLLDFYVNNTNDGANYEIAPNGILAMRLAANGNVGIGTTVPDSKLSVKGNIRAQEVKVETANWPDYVFAKEYQLPTLQETEKHIKDKGHLPGIPSATEVKANGIDLGEMNAKLLQKIEELTLHLIEQNSRNQKQDAIIEKQQNEINQLKNKLSIP